MSSSFVGMTFVLGFLSFLIFTVTGLLSGSRDRNGDGERGTLSSGDITLAYDLAFATGVGVDGLLVFFTIRLRYFEGSGFLSLPASS